MSSISNCIFIYVSVSFSQFKCKHKASSEWEGASLSSAIAQPCPKLSTLHRFALTLQFHNRFIDRPSHAQAKLKWNTSTQLKTFPRSSKFAFPVFCYFVSAQFISCASFSFIISLFFSVQFFCHAQKAPSKDQQIIHFKKYFRKTIQILLLGCLSTRFHGLSLQLRRSIAIDVASTGNGSEISHRGLWLATADTTKV